MPIDNDFGAPFPLTSLLGVSGISGGMSDEDIAWQSYLDYSGLSQTGGSDVYDFGKDLTEEIIAKHSNPEDIDNYIGTREEVIDLLDLDSAVDTFIDTPDEFPVPSTTLPDDPTVEADSLMRALDKYRSQLPNVPTDREFIEDAMTNLQDIALNPDIINVPGGGISDIHPDDILNAGNTDEVFGIDVLDDYGYANLDSDYDPPGEGGEGGEGGKGGEGGGIRDMLSKAYDKLGFSGVLSLIGLLAGGLSGGGSKGQQGGLGAFTSSQVDPYGLGATANYGAMPGSGMGQPVYLPNTNAPIYYPFASEVTKQYNAQQGGPFSFTAGPPPEAMIQNLTSQRIPGVQYVAEGKFIRRNGLTEGPGTETSDDIPAMLSDGEFVTNAEANRGIGAMALLDQGMPQEVAMDPEQQRLAGARQMYLQQAMGQQMAKQLRNG
tara:strand:+ start:3447 stop:4748 length:1302 start_codon:yes stop_codon:yes gene_type:complete